MTIQEMIASKIKQLEKSLTLEKVEEKVEQYKEQKDAEAKKINPILLISIVGIAVIALFKKR